MLTSRTPRRPLAALECGVATPHSRVEARGHRYVTYRRAEWGTSGSAVLVALPAGLGVLLGGAAAPPVPPAALVLAVRRPPALAAGLLGLLLVPLVGVAAAVRGPAALAGDLAAL